MSAQYPELTEDLKNRSFLGMLKIFGPGAIIASVTVGSGETIFASRGGAIFGYSLLWCFVISAVLKGIQVYSGARFITLTGRHPMESWRELPGPKGWFVWFIAVMTIIWMPFWLGGGLPKMLGDFTNWVVGFPGRADPATFNLFGRLWATLFIVVAIIFTWIQSYGFLEKFQTCVVALLLFCMLVAAAVSHPDIMKIITGTLIPTAPSYEPWLLDNFPDFRARSPWVEMVVYLGAIGGGTQDYIGYVGLLRTKAWGIMKWKDGEASEPPTEIDESDENVQRGRGWLWAPFADVFVSFLCVLVFTICFVVLGAAILHPNHEVPSGFDLLTLQLTYLVRSEQAAALQWFLGFIYKTGVFFAFFGTILGAYELYTWTTRECLVAVMPHLKSVPIRKFRLGTLLWCGLGGLALLWGLDKDPVVIVTPAALVGSALTCGLWCFAMLWSNQVHTPKSLRMGAGLQIGLVIAGLVLTIIPIIGIKNYIKGFMKKSPATSVEAPKEREKKEREEISEDLIDRNAPKLDEVDPVRELIRQEEIEEKEESELRDL